MKATASFLRYGLCLLVPIAIASTVYLYLYPIFGSCAFPIPSGNASEAYDLTKQQHWPYVGKNATHDAIIPTKLAPFRLLALGDPQLEGDTSIPILYMGLFPHIWGIWTHITFQSWQWTFRDRIRAVVHDFIDIWLEDIPFIFESGRKAIDLFGNDFYLAHIYRTVHWWTNPTHVTVLGDLVGSQWIEDDEFERRAGRFWNRTFKGGERVPDDVAAYPSKEFNVTGYLNGSPEEDIWTRRVINVAGNHDIGYAGDLTEERLERFEKHFGKANYELRFRLHIRDPEVAATIMNPTFNPDSKRVIPEIRILVVNDMNLDTPARSLPLQDATYAFINEAINTAHEVDIEGVFTLILTHIPMYKPDGICVDAPFFDFHAAEEGGGVKEQYLLSLDASKGFLEGVYGMNGNINATGSGKGRAGVVLNGHDHEGCDTYHFINQTNVTESHSPQWEQWHWRDAAMSSLPGRHGHPGRREITVRSMMADFGGNAGLYSMWFDEEKWEWQYEYAVCPLGRQYFWWFTHILDLIIPIAAIVYVVIGRLESRGVDVDAALMNAVMVVKGWAEFIMDIRVEFKITLKSKQLAAQQLDAAQLIEQKVKEGGKEKDKSKKGHK